MQFITHNFAYNYNAFKKYGELELLSDMVLDDISKLVVFDKQSLLLIIARSGYGITRMPTNKEIIKLLTNKVPTHAALRDNIAKLIILNNSNDKNKGQKLTLEQEMTFKADGYNYKQDSETSKQNKETIDSLSNEVKGCIKSADGLEHKIEQHTKNKLMMEGDIVGKDEVRKAVRRAYIKSGIITSIVIVGGYFLFKRIARMPMFASGGSIEQDYTPQPHAQPMPTPGAAPIDIPAGPPAPGEAASFDEHGFKV